MNERKLRRLFPRATEAFIRANSDRVDDSGSSSKPERVDGERAGRVEGETVLEKTYSLRTIEAEFFANHGKRLDNDNREFLAKIFQDVLVNLNFERNDEEMQSKINQRMHPFNSNI